MSLKSKFRQVNAFFVRHLYLEFLLEAVGMTMLIELISRKTLSGLASFIVNSPLTFMVNVFIIFATLSVTVLIPGRSRFAKDALLIVWAAMGITNGIVLRYRMTPFSAEDLNMVPSLMRIMKNYLTIGSLVALIAAVAAVGVALVILWKRVPRQKLNIHWVNLAGRTVMIAFGCFLFMNMSMQAQAISTDFMNLADAYEEYGFAYCFSTSLVDVGIDKPEGYGEELITDILSGIEIEEGVDTEGTSLLTVTDVSDGDDIKTASSGTDVGTESIEEYNADALSVSASFDSQTPNIIMIQLESFFDPAYLIHYSCSDDPIPNFRSIRENYASGFLTVPVVGAGTANTEFEILTGMSTDYFGAGEYPYNTVLKSTVTEALPQILRQYGYSSTAIHNNTGTFYNRHIVFSNMGFDRFIPLEYMYDTEETPNNWIKDNILTEIMMDALEASDGPDFLYTITVQSHGRYPSEKVLDDPEITVSCDDENVNVNPVEYYVNMIHEVDEMIGELTDALAQSGEPTVLIMYGDHLPALGFEAEDLSLPSLYTTEYVIWNNFGLEMEDRDIQAESLGTAVLQKFGLDNGIIPRFHEVYDGTEEYSAYLEALEYDMFYGDGYVYQDITPYEASDIAIGYLPISITGYSIEDDGLYIQGENFNEYSLIVIDGKVKTTEYVDRSTLVLRDIPKTVSKLWVGQFDDQQEQLGESTNELTDVIIAAEP